MKKSEKRLARTRHERNAESSSGVCESHSVNRVCVTLLCS